MKLTFLVADEIRREASGKATILGLFPDNVVIVNIPPKPEGIPEGVPPGIDRLSFMVNVSSLPEGTYHFKAQFISPSGKPMGEVMEVGDIEIAAGKSFTTIFQSNPFVILEGGEYNLAFNINDEEHRLPFEIRINPLA